MVSEGECMGHSPGDKPLTLTRCHSCGLSQQYEAFVGWKSVCGQAYSLKDIKGKFSIFLLFLNHSGIKECHLLGTNLDPVSTCNRVVLLHGNVVS